MVRKYVDGDFEAIQQWGKAWGADYQKDLFPSTGYIYPGVAAYFIYGGGDSKVCWLENMVTNPSAEVIPGGQPPMPGQMPGGQPPQVGQMMDAAPPVVQQAQGVNQPNMPSPPQGADQRSADIINAAKGQ